MLLYFAPRRAVVFIFGVLRFSEKFTGFQDFELRSLLWDFRATPKVRALIEKYLFATNKTFIRVQHIKFINKNIILKPKMSWANNCNNTYLSRSRSRSSICVIESILGMKMFLIYKRTFV